MFKYLIIFIVSFLLCKINTQDLEYEVIQTKNSSNLKYVPFSIYMDFKVLDVDKKGINKIKIEMLKKNLLNAKFIYESLLSINSQYHIFTPKFNLGQLCKNEKLNDIRAIGFYTNLIIFPILGKNISYSDGYIDYYICNIFDKNNRPLIATLTISQKIFYLDENDIFSEIVHSLFHILGFRIKAKKVAGIKNLCSGYSFENLQMKKVAKKYNGIYTSKINLFSSDSRYLHWSQNIKYDIMSLKSFRSLNFNEYSLRYLQILKWYRVNMDICGCSLKGECSFGVLPYEMFINKDTLNLYCYRNEIFNEQCLINNNIFYLKQKKYNDIHLNNSKSYFISGKCRNYDVIYDYNENLLYKGLINSENFEGQNITLVSPLLNDYCKCHLKTIYLFNKFDRNYNNFVINNYKLERHEIKDLNKLVYGSFTSFNSKHSDSFRETLEYNNILILNTEYSPNILFSLLYRDMSNELMSHLNKYTLFRGSQNLYKLGNKNTTYLLYSEFKKKFPKDFDYMTESYIMPNEKNIVKNKFKNYIQKEDDLWLCKPSNGSLGEGIYFLKNYEDFLNCSQLIVKYIHNPHLYKKRKYHIRIYNFVSSFIPLKIYLYKEGQVMRASHDYKYDLINIKDKQSFLTNGHINFGKDGYNKDISIEDLKNEIIKEGENWDLIWKQIKDICIKIIITIYDEEYQKLKVFTNLETKSFMFLGLDIMIDENYKVWFLEANDAAHMEGYDDVNRKNKIGISTDMLNILGIIPFDHSNEIPEGNLSCKFNNKIEEMINNAFCEFYRPQGNLERIFPVKETLTYYKKFFLNKYKENLELWKLLK